MLADRTLIAGAGTAALASLCAGVAIALHHPLSPSGALCAFALWAILVFRRPSIWLVLLPGLLPVLGLAPWTGWIAVDEFDIALLATAAGGYLALATNVPHKPEQAPLAPRQPPVLVLPGKAAWILGALAGSCVLSLMLGLVHAERVEFGWFDSYTSATNTLRVAKSTFAFLLLVPLLVRAHSGDPHGTAAALCRGMVIGVFLASLAALWERLAFAGLFDFSRYYRTSGLFVENHVGGAAFDAYLALGMPFVVRGVFHAKSRCGGLVAVLVLLLAVYACISTLSRSLFLAMAIGAIVGIGCLRLPGATGGTKTRFPAWHALAAIALVMAMTGAAFLAFSLEWYGAAVAMAAFSLLSAWCADRWGSGTRRARMLAIVVLCLGALLVVNAWSGGGGVYLSHATSLVLGGAAAACAVVLAERWHPAGSRPRRLAGLGLALLLAVELAAILSGGSFVSRRFDRSASDIDARLNHWKEASGLLRSPADWLFGRGIGRFPAEYAAASPTVEFPGGFDIIGAGAEIFARVYGPATVEQMAGVFGMSQRIGPAKAGSYVATFEARVFRQTRILAAICERHLVYEAACAAEYRTLEPGDWRLVELKIDGTDLEEPGRLPRPVFLSIAVNQAGRMLDVRSLRLRDPDGNQVLANGDFAAGGARWFLTGRYIFLPWHTDSLWLELLVERGTVGLIAWMALLGFAVASWLRQARRAREDAPWFVAAFAAIVVTGSLGSVIDVPRVAFALQLLLGYSLLRPVGESTGGR